MHVYGLLCDAWPDHQVRFYIYPDDPVEYNDSPTEDEGAVYVYDISLREPKDLILLLIEIAITEAGSARPA